MINLQSLVDKLFNFNEMQQHDIIESETTVLLALMKWNDKNCFLVMDLLRVYCLHRDSQQTMNSVDNGLRFLIYCASCLKFQEKKYIVLVLRFLCNIFMTNPQVFIKNESIILEMFEKVDNLFDFTLANLMIILYKNYLSYAVQERMFLQPFAFFNYITGLNLEHLK